MSSFGFGSNNNNSGSTFGFGASNNSGGGFGANNNTSTGGSLFGGNTATSGGGFGGFGANNNNATSAFGAKPAGGFGASTSTPTSGGLFGNTASSGSGFGFGSNNNAASNTSGGFGNSTGGGLFGGAAKPAATGFGSNSGTSLFGGGNSTGGFGSGSNTASNPFGGSNTNTTGGFGSTNNTAGGFGASSTGGGGFGGFGASAGTASNNNQGTAAVPFQATNEKDGATNSTSAYQSITFQEPYKNKCFEELRVEDYMQGRRYGNNNGQAGSFGQSTGFGGTTTNATSGGGLFGGNTATTGGFGSNTANNASTGFGANNSGTSLFGQNKPAGSSLFGGGAATGTTGGFGSSTTGSTGGGLFGGGNNNTAGGFGATNTATNTGTGLFGNSTNNTQSPFGASNTNNASTGLFGNNNAAQKPAGGLFGNNTTSTTGGGLFGQQNNQQQQSNPFGASTTNTNTGTGLFGNNNAAQAKPAFGGFGQSTNTGTGFGASNTGAAGGGGLFGNSTAQSNTGNSLFGNANTQNKPASTGLFGASNTSNTGTSLFGNSTNNTTGGGLFGGANNNTANNSNSLFGNKPAGTGLFGNTNTNTNTNSGLSLFGNSGQNQNQNNNGNNNSLFGGNNSTQNNNSLFGNSQQSQQQNQLHTSLTVSPYGNDQLFSSLAAPSPPVGPLATPLAGAKPTPKRNQSLLGSVRLNSPVYTPRASTLGRTNGYGLSYSTYGSPNSSFSGNLTPGASSMLKPTGSIGSGLASRLSKSFSTNNLRSDGTPESASLLRPGALSSSNGRYSSGSMRKLKIDRSLREDLFGTPQKSSDSADDGRDSGKRVNFDETPNKDATTATSGALVRTEEDEQDAEITPKSRAPPRKTGSGAQEMEQVNRSGPLSTVPESGSAARSAPTPDAVSDENAEPGTYWTKPSIDHLKKMSRSQLQKIGKFTVGRQGVGKIEFGPCDLTSVPLDDICGNIVQLNPRSATVYLDENDKPPMGQQLNVPSTISLEHSWPRSNGGKQQILEANTKAYDKHIARLSRIGGTHFVSYEPETGVWTFKVDHFTTYGLDDDDEDEDVTAASKQEFSVLSDAPSTPGQDDTMHSMDAAVEDMDDTFQFKLDGRSQMSVPGGLEFDGVPYDYDDQPLSNADRPKLNHHEESEVENTFASSGGPVQAPSPNTLARFQASMGEEDGDLFAEYVDELEDLPGTFVPEPKMPRSILKPSMGLGAFASPEKLATETWEDQLQRTMSPKKRDRLALKDLQKSILKARDENEIAESPFKQSILGQSLFGQSYLAQKSAKKNKTNSSIPNPFAAQNDLNKSKAFTTSMDIMNSLWADEKSAKKATAGNKGFEYPYLKKPRLSTSEESNDQDFEFHNSFKPSFAATGTFTYAVPGSTQQVTDILAPTLQPFIGAHNDVRFARFVPPTDLDAPILKAQQSNEHTQINLQDGGLPIAETMSFTFVGLADEVQSDATTHEHAIWQLCSLLYDPLDVVCPDEIGGMEEDVADKFASRFHLKKFASVWAQLVSPESEASQQQAKTAEEQALHCLTRNDVRGACDVLIGAKDMRLAMLVSQLPGSDQSRTAMANQIDAWRDRKDWSEMAEPVRAIYSILAGEICEVSGQEGAAEDKANEFCLAERFGLSWRQSFGLRVFFGGHEVLTDAIAAYIQDLESEQETVRPTNAWNPEAEDTLMGLLRLCESGIDVAQLLDPVAVSGSATNSRLAWQLATLLKAKNIALADDEMDRLTIDFATELEAASIIGSAVWALLHIRDAEIRTSAVKGFLERNASIIAAPNADGEANDFSYLTNELLIPASLIWAAKAPYAKANEGDFLQADWLLKAHQSDPQAGYDNEAHDLLCTSVGPEAVIGQDYERLGNLLAEFDLSARKPEGWGTGAQVYGDFLRLLNMSTRQKNKPEGEAALKRLRVGLQEMEANGEQKTLEQRVAALEMSKFAEELAKDRGLEYEEDAAMQDVSIYGNGMDLLDRYQRALGEVR